MRDGFALVLILKRPPSKYTWRSVPPRRESMLRRIDEQLARHAGQLFIRPMMVNHDPLRCGSVLHKLAAMQNDIFAGSSIGYSTK